MALNFECAEVGTRKGTWRSLRSDRELPVTRAKRSPLACKAGRRGTYLAPKPLRLWVGADSEPRSRAACAARGGARHDAELRPEAGPLAAAAGLPVAGFQIPLAGPAAGRGKPGAWRRPWPDAAALRHAHYARHATGAGAARPTRKSRRPSPSAAAAAAGTRPPGLGCRPAANLESEQGPGSLARQSRPSVSRPSPHRRERPGSSPSCKRLVPVAALLPCSF